MRALTVALFFLSFSALAQNNSINIYPWNPDSDQDNHIGVEDLQSFLTVYGNDFGLPPEPCTYDGTPLEELMAGISDGTIILDSMFIEYELEDVSTYYILPCPEPIEDTLIFANTAMLYHYHFDSSPYSWYINGLDTYGGHFSFQFLLNTGGGTYRFRPWSQTLADLGFEQDGFFGGSMYGFTPWSSIPFPADWYLDEDGIHLESGWDEDDWPFYANYMHILPYWHYADE